MGPTGKRESRGPFHFSPAPWRRLSGRRGRHPTSSCLTLVWIRERRPFSLSLLPLLCYALYPAVAAVAGERPDRRREGSLGDSNALLRPASLFPSRAGFFLSDLEFLSLRHMARGLVWVEGWNCGGDRASRRVPWLPGRTGMAGLLRPPLRPRGRLLRSSPPRSPPPSRGCRRLPAALAFAARGPCRVVRGMILEVRPRLSPSSLWLYFFLRWRHGLWCRARSSVWLLRRGALLSVGVSPLAWEFGVSAIRVSVQLRNGTWYWVCIYAK